MLRSSKIVNVFAEYLVTGNVNTIFRNPITCRKTCQHQTLNFHICQNFWFSAKISSCRNYPTSPNCICICGIIQFYSVLLKYFLSFQYFVFEQLYEKFSSYVNIFISLNFKKPVKIKKRPFYSK